MKLVVISFINNKRFSDFSLVNLCKLDFSVVFLIINLFIYCVEIFFIVFFFDIYKIEIIFSGYIGNF